MLMLVYDVFYNAPLPKYLKDLIHTSLQVVSNHRRCASNRTMISVLCRYLGSKQLHYGNPSINIHIHQWLEAFRRHEVHYDIISLRLDEVEVRRPREVAGERVRHSSWLISRHNVIGAHISQRGSYR